MAQLLDKRFDAMTVAELKQACNLLGENSTPNGKPVLRGQINKALRAGGRPNAKTLNEYFGPAQKRLIKDGHKDTGAYHKIESLRSPVALTGGRKLCLTLTKVRGLILKVYNGDASQQWRLSEGSYGSLQCKADPNGRVTVVDAVSWGEEHALRYEPYASDAASLFAYNSANNTYQLSAPWKPYSFAPTSLERKLVLAVNEGGDMCANPFITIPSNSQVKLPLMPLQP